MDGKTEIDWSVHVEADSKEEAVRKAEAFWPHNTVSENVEVQAIFNQTTGEVE